MRSSLSEKSFVSPAVMYKRSRRARGSDIDERLHLEVRQALGHLDDRSRQVITGLFGIDEQKRTHTELSGILDLDPERVEALSVDALRTLRGAY